MMYTHAYCVERERHSSSDAADGEHDEQVDELAVHDDGVE